jgi:hypothetical protein
MVKDESKEELLQGEWHLPGYSKFYPGVIRKNGEKLIFCLYGPEYIDGSDPKDIKNPRVIDHPIILGKCRQSALVTLYSCQWRGTKNIGGNLCEIKYDVYAIFEGAQISKPELLKIKRASTHFPSVSSWYDGWGSTEKAKEALKRGQGYDEVTVKINDNLSLKYIDYYHHHDHFDGHLIEVKYSKWVDFEYETPVSFDRALYDWIRFKRMLEFTTMGKEINFQVSLLILSTKDIVVKKDRYGADPDYTTVRVQYNHLSKRDPVKPSFIHQNGMLFSRWKLGTELLDAITRQWFANEKFYPIYDYYLDSNNWFSGSGVHLSNVMFNNRFLNLIQALESYHYLLNEQYNPDNNLFTRNRQIVLNLTDDPELKKWLHNTLKFPKEHSLLDRLDALIARFSPYLIKLFGKLDYLQSFSVESKDLRHLLSHGRHKSTFLGERLYPNYYIAKILLCLCILESLQIEPIVITKIVELNYELNDNVNEVIYRHRMMIKKQKDSEKG